MMSYSRALQLFCFSLLAGLIASCGEVSRKSVAAASFSVQSAAPEVDDVNPEIGANAGGYNVIIDGAGFQSQASVTFGGIYASVSSISGNQITVVAPPGTEGQVVDITVTNPDGQSATLSQGFLYSDIYSEVLTLQSIAPANGPAAGGTTVTLTGTNFEDGMTVTIGAADCTNMQVPSSTQATCVTPAGATGPASVVAQNPDGGGAMLATGFTYAAGAPAPGVTAISPSSGSSAGGTTVTITGTNFDSGATVTFDGIAATTVQVVSATSLTCVTPADSAGAVDVVLTNSDGQQTTMTAAFQYIDPPPPSISGITPASGVSTGGTPVTITGTNFVNGATVTFDGINANSVHFVSATSITCVTPADNPGSVDVVVTNPDSQQSTLTQGFQYISPPPPAITNLSPNNGPDSGGTVVTITGTNFVNGAVVTFDGYNASNVKVVSATTITCTTPPDSGRVDVVVTNLDQQTFTFAGGFQYNDPPVIPAPEISTISPSTGPSSGGTTVTITGTGFQAGIVPSFDGRAASQVKFISSSEITCVTPADSEGDVNVVLTNPDGQVSDPGDYTYADPAPAVYSLSPSSGPSQGGTATTITGANFKAGATVFFDGIPAGSVSILSAGTITAVSPADSAGVVDVTVTNPDGQGGTLSSSFTYVDPANAGASINVNGGGSQYLFTDQGAVIYWGSANAVSCEVDWNNDSTYLASGLGGQVAPPAQDYVNDDTFGVTCTNPIGEQANAEVSVYRMAHAVGGTKHALYVLATAADATLCAKKIAAAGSACATGVRIGRTRDVINQGGIAFDNPNSCRCNHGDPNGAYKWF